MNIDEQYTKMLAHRKEALESLYVNIQITSRSASLSSMQLDVLIALDYTQKHPHLDASGSTVSYLLDRDKSNVARCIKYLKKIHMIKKDTKTVFLDDRKTLYVLTQDGQSCVNGILDDLYTQHIRAMSRMDTSEVQALDSMIPHQQYYDDSHSQPYGDDGMDVIGSHRLSGYDRRILCASTTLCSDKKLQKAVAHCARFLNEYISVDKGHLASILDRDFRDMIDLLEEDFPHKQFCISARSSSLITLSEKHSDVPLIEVVDVARAVS